MPRLIVIFLMLLASPALADKIEHIDAPSGITVDYVKCSRNPNRCMKEVAKYCGGSYQVIDSESHSGTLVSDIFAGGVTWYSMTFLCGISDGRLPDFPYRGPNAARPSAVIPPQISTICTVLGKTRTCRSQ
ncbi:MAG: hypothetical protein V9G14_10905 [Cypionkella sp.]|nr:hypothetical protein [Cypionkella sp.]